MIGIVMFDAVDVSQIPASAPAVAGYVDGRWATFARLPGMFPHAHRLSIAVTSANDADCLDIETGDATPADAAGWYQRQKAHGRTRPCLYASASVMQAGVVPAIEAAGIARSAVRLWSAHYTGSPHICGPSSCGAMSISADGTQWTNQALGRDLDESLLAPDFFGSPGPPSTGWTAAMISDLPQVKQGDAGNNVRTVQALCVARGHATTVDGAFGAATATSVRAVQTSFGITVDGTVGPATWAVLVTAQR